MKPIPGYEGLYAITEDGRVWSYPKEGTGGHDGKFLKSFRSAYYIKNYYLFLRLSKNKVSTRFTIHRLLGLTYIPNPDSKPQVNHINGTKYDNRLENLEWSTDRENKLHSYRVLGNKLSPSHLSKLHKNAAIAHCRKIGQYTIQGKLIKTFISIESAKILLHINNISACVRGIQKTAGGFVWKYLNQ